MRNGTDSQYSSPLSEASSLLLPLNTGRADVERWRDGLRCALMNTGKGGYGQQESAGLARFEELKRERACVRVRDSGDMITFFSACRRTFCTGPTPPTFQCGFLSTVSQSMAWFIIPSILL